MIRKLTDVEICRVDALCMGPAHNQWHPHYEWTAADWQQLTTGTPTTKKPTVWQKLKALFGLGW